MQISTRPLKTLAAIGLLSLATVSAQAGIITLSTGLDASDTLITVGNTLDAHWTVDQPASGIAAAKVVDPSNADWFSGWLANGPNSSWITINPNTSANGSVIPYSYYRTFTLSSADIGTATISGAWTIDDGGTLNLNGTQIDSLGAGNWGGLHTFASGTASTLLVAGVNTLKITMTSSDNFLEAVRFEGSINGVSAAVPEPSTLLVAVTGIILGGVSLRRSSQRKQA